VIEIRDNDLAVSPEELAARPHGRLMGLEDCLPLLASPDTRCPLARDGDAFTDGENRYELRDGLPVLIPARLQPYFTYKLDVPLAHYGDSFLQYFLLSTIKQSGEINAPPTEDYAHRHFHRAVAFLENATGLTLDVGCDDPVLGTLLLPEGSHYVGLDPFCSRSEPFRVVGVGEFLPFGDGTFDNVLFNTSLDHIMDWHQAIDEAVRVLKPGGSVYILVYVWTDRATLLTDSVHFHHYRDYEILGKLAESGLTVVDEQRWISLKRETHRHQLFVRASKP
jgi:SAM-dependent methyltransferase